jgi:hypothetical protein
MNEKPIVRAKMLRRRGVRSAGIRPRTATRSVIVHDAFVSMCSWNGAGSANGRKRHRARTASTDVRSMRSLTLLQLLNWTPATEIRTSGTNGRVGRRQAHLAHCRLQLRTAKFERGIRPFMAATLGRLGVVLY